MTFRSTPIELELEDLHKGQKVDGVIKAKEKYGLFIQIKDAKVSGLCHKSEVKIFEHILKLSLLISYPIRFQTIAQQILNKFYKALWWEIL